ncbi:hypothetical protein [Rhizobacter sp. Root1221]|uniref:hypothetical protein n=1 Tax=Rhizobacter sp. Root1221 TaxID=1736433 RepID=UPI000713800B|nr:hypothetical protein [Rhizobacter sp. Root1221]KQV85418.1 hypothetical protein ASC87_06930 [Rhizobacter sp. Root1221]
MRRRVMRETGRFVVFDCDGGKHTVRLLQQFEEIVSAKRIKVEPTSKAVHQLEDGDLVVALDDRVFEVVRTRELLTRP